MGVPKEDHAIVRCAGVGNAHGRPPEESAPPMETATLLVGCGPTAHGLSHRGAAAGWGKLSANFPAPSCKFPLLSIPKPTSSFPKVGRKGFEE